MKLVVVELEARVEEEEALPWLFAVAVAPARPIERRRPCRVCSHPFQLLALLRYIFLQTQLPSGDQHKLARSFVRGTCRKVCCNKEQIASCYHKPKVLSI